jgi:hypothetical protein
VSHVPAVHPMTDQMRSWCAEAELEWQDPHFVFTGERDDTQSEASWEWWRGDRYLSGVIWGDPAEQDEISLYGSSVRDVGTHRPFTREGFLDLWRQFTSPANGGVDNRAIRP